jgi:ParB family chromosome partitioning protein
MRELKRISVSDIERDPEQPRKLFDEQELVSLGQNMLAHGQQVPVIVYSPEVGNGDGKGRRFRLLDGERRWRGAQLAVIGELDAIILAQRPNDTALHVLQMSLEAHKQGLTAMERSNLLQRIRAENNWQVTELAEKLHMKQSVVSKVLAYQKLEPSIQAMLHRGEIDTERAFIISQETDPAKQLKLVKGAGGLTRQQLRQRTKGGGAKEVKTSNARFPLPTGWCVTVQGRDGRDVSLATAIEAMMEAVKELKKAQGQGLDITTAQRVMRDKAKAR